LSTVVATLTAGYAFSDISKAEERSVNISEKDEEISSVVDKLKKTGVTMYGAYWCPHCTRQLDLFDKYKGDVPYIECGIPEHPGAISDECRTIGVRGVPTWGSATGESFLGKASLTDLQSFMDYLDKKSPGETNFKEKEDSQACKPNS